MPLCGALNLRERSVSFGRAQRFLWSLPASLRVPSQLLLFWLTAGAALAQVPAAPVRFTVFATRATAEVAFVPRPGAAPQKVVFYPTARSPVYEYRGPMPLLFLDPATGAVVAEAKIPPEIARPLLLFTPVETPAGKSGLRYQIAVLDDGAARHGPGGLAIVNLSGLALAGTVGKEKITLRAGLNPTLPVGRTTAVALRTVFRERSYQAYAGTVKLARDERALLLLLPPFYKGSLEVQSRLLVDAVPAAAK